MLSKLEVLRECFVSSKSWASNRRDHGVFVRCVLLLQNRIKDILRYVQMNEFRKFMGLRRKYFYNSVFRSWTVINYGQPTAPSKNGIQILASHKQLKCCIRISITWNSMLVFRLSKLRSQVPELACVQDIPSLELSSLMPFA